MASVKYTKSISTDFTGLTEADISLEALNDELQASSIVTALDYIERSGDTVDIWFKEALSAGDQTTLTNVVNTHTGVWVDPQEFSFSSWGAVVTSKTHSSYEEDTKFKGMLIQASGVDTDTIYDHLITTELYMAGGQYWADGGVIGDYAECSVVDKDDVLGLFDTYGLVSGVDVLELTKFAETIYLKPGGCESTVFDTDDVSYVASGLYLRTKIHTTTATSVDLGVNYKWFEV